MTDHLFSRTPWEHQRHGVEETISNFNKGNNSICLTAPTGSGKTSMMIALAKWEAEDRGGRVLCLTNRIMLTDQTRRVFENDNIPVGTISASMKHLERKDAPVQIATIQTILSRQREQPNYWVDADLVLADEIHQLSGAGSESATLLNEYQERGHNVCGVTATPLGVCTVCDQLVVAGRTRDLQQQGILCSALWFAPSELDTRNLVKAKIDLSLTENDARRTWGPLKGDSAIRARIVGNIIDNYKRLHPTLTHTLAFAPGVKESLWAAQFSVSMGIRALHIDAKDFWVDGKTYDRAANPKLLEESMEAWREGHIPILWNRFLFREGIDEPQIQCILLATPIGSYRSFLQMVGRGLRKHPDKEHCTVIDFAGAWWRHGSVNVNVDWESVFFYEDPDLISKARIHEQREEGGPMGQVCPKCGMVHKPKARMITCQYCGHQMHLGKPSRPIIQADGKLTQVSGEPIKKWKISDEPGDDKLWAGLYHNAVNKGYSFAELYQQFNYKKAVKFGTKTRPDFRKAYYPPRNFPFMPINKYDWWRKASVVPRDDLH